MRGSPWCAAGIVSLPVAVAQGVDGEGGADGAGFLQQLTPDRLCVRAATSRACPQACRLKP
jgi:hypothetical protein